MLLLLLGLGLGPEPALVVVGIAVPRRPPFGPRLHPSTAGRSPQTSHRNSNRTRPPHLEHAERSAARSSSVTTGPARRFLRICSAARCILTAAGSCSSTEPESSAPQREHTPSTGLDVIHACHPVVIARLASSCETASSSSTWLHNPHRSSTPPTPTDEHTPVKAQQRATAQRYAHTPSVTSLSLPAIARAICSTACHAPSEPSPYLSFSASSLANRPRLRTCLYAQTVIPARVRGASPERSGLQPVTPHQNHLRTANAHAISPRHEHSNRSRTALR